MAQKPSKRLLLLISTATRVVVRRARIGGTRGRFVAVAGRLVGLANEAIGGNGTLQQLGLIRFVLSTVELDVAPHANFSAGSVDKYFVLISDPNYFQL